MVKVILQLGFPHTLSEMLFHDKRRSLDYSFILFMPKCWLQVCQHHVRPATSRSVHQHVSLHRMAAGTKVNVFLKFSPQYKWHLLLLLWARHFLKPCYFSHLFQIHTSVDFFLSKSPFVFRSFSFQTGSAIRTASACLLLLCCLSGNIFQITWDCLVLKAFSLQNDSTTHYFGFSAWFVTIVCSAHIPGLYIS